MKNILVLFAAIIGLNLHAQTTENSLLIKTENGLLKGASENGVDTFKGIPFALPPVGELRWRAPQPAQDWEGVRDALEFGPNCAQNGWGNNGGIAAGSSEDCLYLNVWRPEGLAQGNKAAVMVWIHGGGFVFGSGSSPDTDGGAFAKQGVILVTVNYRLARFGFFAFPALSKEHPEEPKGNYAYMDQIAALKWIKNNIAAFGGDPNNVTIFGESAGGVSVQSLLTIPSANGLFQKAIVESGGGRDGVLTARPLKEDNSDRFYPVSAETAGINFARKHGINGTDAAALAQLRALPVEQIVDGGAQHDSKGSLTYSGVIFDGKLVVETAESVYNNGNQNDADVMIGSNSAEVQALNLNAENKEELFSKFGSLAEEAKKVFDPTGEAPLAEILTKVNTDNVWAEPARFTASAVTKGGKNAYVYIFSYVTESMKERAIYGAPHASEIPYAFGNLNARWGVQQTTDEDIQMSKLMNTYWANFAKTGSPNSEGLPNWPLYDDQNEGMIEFQADGTAVGKPNPKKVRLDLIQKAVTLKELKVNGI